MQPQTRSEPPTEVVGVETDEVARRRDEAEQAYVVEPDLQFIEDLEKFGSKTHKECYQCATCSATTAGNAPRNVPGERIREKR